MQPRFVGRLGLADAVTVTNAAVGFAAAVLATVDAGLAARLVLFGAIADGLDGVVARKRGSTPVGSYLDSLADVASFGVAPAMVVAVRALDAANYGSGTGGAGDLALAAAAVVVPAVYVAMAVTRLGMYTAYDTDHDETEGVPTTLAATILAAAILAGYTNPVLLLGVTAVFAGLMVSKITYPDLHPQDALVMGLVQAATVLTPGFWGRVFAFALLFLAAGYLILGPRFYWRNGLGSGSSPVER
ncbi:MAG: protein sorting system archaetidylserine synthase [Halopenitus sp.]